MISDWRAFDFFPWSRIIFFFPILPYQSHTHKSLISIMCLPKSRLVSSSATCRDGFRLWTDFFNFFVSRLFFILYTYKIFYRTCSFVLKRFHVSLSVPARIVFALQFLLTSYLQWVATVDSWPVSTTTVGIILMRSNNHMFGFSDFDFNWIM